MSDKDIYWRDLLPQGKKNMRDYFGLSKDPSPNTRIVLVEVPDQFEIDHYSRADKVIRIGGPGDLLIYVDFDDVNHEEIELAVPKLVKILNNYWDLVRYDS